MAIRKEIRFCPKCRSEDVALDGALIGVSAGAMICKSCGYRNVNFPIKEKITKDKIRKQER